MPDLARLSGIYMEVSAPSPDDAARVSGVYMEVSAPYITRARVSGVYAEVSARAPEKTVVAPAVDLVLSAGPAVAIEHRPVADVVEAPLTWWTPTHGDPHAARHPWSKIGAGGSLTAKGMVVTAGSSHGYRRPGTTRHDRERMELQVRFQGSTSAPLWASGASGHVIAIDDGYRRLGVAIGDTMHLIDADSGDILYTPETQPGGWTTRRIYRLIKVGTASWELYVDGVRAFRVPYHLAPATTFGVATFDAAWLDATPGAAGVGTWSELETAIGLTLAPGEVVDRARITMPALLQDAWTDRHEAFLRAMVGLTVAAGDRMDRVAELFTAAALPIAEAELVGDVVPASVSGWTEVGSGSWSVERERIRIDGSTTPTYARYDLPIAPQHPDLLVWSVANTFTVVEATPDAAGHVGPYLQIRDGAHVVGAALLQDGSNPDRWVWRLLGSEPSATPAQLGDTAATVSRYGEHRVELVLIERTHVLLLVDGDVVDESDYARFVTATTSYDARIGADGSATLSTVVLMEAARVRVTAADSNVRPLFLRRIAERLLFASGCESNGRLDVWLRRLPGVIRARGTDRVLPEIRRLTCDDDAQLVTERIPPAWYLGVTFPGVTPVFLDPTGPDLVQVTAEIEPHAPNFTWAELVALIKRYLLPRSVFESRYAPARRTTLTSGTSAGGGGSTWTVDDGDPFEAGDSVALRQATTSTLMTVEYDDTDPRAADTMQAGVDNGRVWAVWTCSEAGAWDEIDASTDLAGLDGDRLAAITGGNRVGVVGAGLDVDVQVEVFGVLSGTAQSERLRAIGTTQTDGVDTWTTVHGAICHQAAQDDVDIVDQGTGTVLYTIPGGARSIGVHLFDPPLRIGPSVVGIVADAATTDVILVAGPDAAAPGTAVDTLEDVALNGTTPVATVAEYQMVRAIPAGYLAAARTITVSPRTADPGTTTIRLVSSSASDTQTARLVYLDTNNEAQLIETVLTGTTVVVVTLASPLHRLAGCWLGSAAVGTVTVTTDADAVQLAQLAPAASSVGMSLRAVDCIGQIGFTADANPDVPTYAVAVGLDEDGALQVEAYRVSTTEQATAASWSRYLGSGLGAVDPAITVEASGLAWTFGAWERAVSAITALPWWTVSGPAGAADAFDGGLADLALTDATAALAMSGTWSTVEETVLLSVVGDTVVSQVLTNTFSSGATMRRTE